MISNSSAGVLLQRGFSYVRQLSTSSDTANSTSVGHEICEQLLLDKQDETEIKNLPESDEEMFFEAIETPKAGRVICKTVLAFRGYVI